MRIFSENYFVVPYFRNERGEIDFEAQIKKSLIDQLREAGCENPDYPERAIYDLSSNSLAVMVARTGSQVMGYAQLKANFDMLRVADVFVGRRYNEIKVTNALLSACRVNAPRLGFHKIITDTEFQELGGQKVTIRRLKFW